MDAMQEEIEDECSGPYFPFDRNERYPKRLKVDFRKLAVRVRACRVEQNLYQRFFFLFFCIS